MSDPITDAANATAKLLETEPVKNLACPPTQEIGLTLGTIASVFRFYVEDNLVKLFPRWARQRNNRPVSNEEVRKVLPLLQAASLQHEEELQERWAALLESTLSNPGNVLPSFGQTLSQLTAEEARFLDRLWGLATRPSPCLEEYAFGRRRFDHSALLSAYDPNIFAMNPAERALFDKRLTAEQRANYDRLQQAELVFQDLERLGILSRDQVTERNPFPSPFGAPVRLETAYSISEYGVRFIQAVTPNKPE